MTAVSTTTAFCDLQAALVRAELEVGARRALIGPLATGRRFPLGRPIPLPAPRPLVVRVRQVEADLALATLGRSAVELACGLSRHLPGQFWWGSSGVCWNRGGKCFWLMDWQHWEQAKQGREVLAGLGIPCRSWTLGGMARAVLKWLGLRQRHFSCSERHLGGVGAAYARVIPGAYAGACLYDLDAAYFSILQRLPSPRLTWVRGQPLWHPLTPDEQGRWEAVKAACGASKGIRNALVGAMQGGGIGSACYVKGEPLPGKRPAGPLVTAARTVQRTCYELCYLQADASQAPYARTDCVLLLHDQQPHIWQRYGYGFSDRAQGVADVVGLDVYRVGDKQTKWYGCRSLAHPAPFSQAPPPVLTLTAWH